MIENSLLGGEFDVAPDALMAPAPAPFGQRPQIIASTGRCALRMIVAALRSRCCPSILLPAFICQSVIDPFVEAGLPVEFFPIDKSLQINLPAMADLLREHPDSALLFVNYFGFSPQPAQLRMLRRETERRVVIEDCSHGSWIESDRPAGGTVGSIVLSSMRKYLPLPDGCALLDRSKLLKQRLDRTVPPFVAPRFVGAQLKHVYLQSSDVDATVESAYLKLLASAERSIDLSKRSYRISSTSKRLLKGMDLRFPMKRRRANFRSLLQAFSGNRRLRSLAEPLVQILPAGVSPFAFPIRVKGAGRRNGLRASLAAQRLFCAVHWPAPAAVEAVRFPEAIELAGQILSLPVDQRYGPAHMREIVRRLEVAFAEL